MKKNSIIAGLFVFCITTAGIGYTVYNSVYSDRQKHRINETAKLDSAKAPNELKDGEYTASAEGYEGPITVKVVIKEGKIFSVEVLSHNETPEYYEMAKKILQTIVEKNTFNVDSISGATVTSDAIKVAVYKALVQAGAKTSDVAESLEKENEELRDKEKAKLLAKQSSAVAGKVGFNRNNLKDGTFIGVGRGYNGPIKVSISIKNGVIYDARVISHSDDYPYFTWASSVLNKVISGSTNIDTVSGATVSSRGILNAVKDALRKASNGNNSLDINSPDETEQNIPRQNRREIEQIKKYFKGLKDGVYFGKSNGYYTNSIEVKVTVKDGKIAKIELTKNDDDESYFDNKKAGILGERIISNQSTNIDTISGATTSSKGFINAVVNALEKAVDSNGSDADKYIYSPKTIIANVGETIGLQKIRDALEKLPEDVQINIKNNADTSSEGKTKIVVELIFKDNSKKIVEIPVLVNSKVDGSYKFLSAEEVKNLDKNVNYPDGVYYGDSYGFVSNKPIPVKVTIKNNKIENVELVKEELNRLKGVTSPGNVDDGGIFQEKFYTIIDRIKNMQKFESLIYKFEVLRDATSKVMEEARGKEQTVEVYRAALDKVIGKHNFGKWGLSIDESHLKGERNIHDRIFSLLKIYVREELGYDGSDYDAVSGATFTATGTATSIKNALLKAKNFDFYDMRVDDSNFKTSYKEGDKLDLKDLKVTIYKKNNQKITVSYSDFGKYGLKVVDEYNKELKDGLVLNKENLGYNVTDGLRLKVVHEESKSFKFLNTILISKSTTKNFEISGIKIKAKDGSEWYDTKGYNTTDFIQNLTVSKEVAEKLNNKEIEFKIIAKDKKSSEEIEIPLRQAQNKTLIADFVSGEYTLDVIEKYKGVLFNNTFRIKTKVEGKIPKAFLYKETPETLIISKGTEIIESKIRSVLKNLPDKTDISVLREVDVNKVNETVPQKLLIKLKFDDGSEKEIEIDVIVKEKVISMADKYVYKPKDLITIKGKEVELSHLKNHLNDLPEGTKIEIIEKANVSEVNEAGTLMKVRLEFTDKSTKDISINVIVKDTAPNKAEEFKILYPEIKNEIVNVVVKDSKYGNTEKFAETVKWGAFSDFAINRDLKLKSRSANISRIEVLKEPDRSKLGDQKGKIRLSFNDGSKLELEISVKIVPYPVYRIFKLTSNKTQYKLDDKFNLNDLKVTLFISNKLENESDWATTGTPILNIPYSDFHLFGIKVVELDSKKEIENDSIISSLIKNKKLSVGAYCENLIQKNDYESAKKLVEISKITITNIDEWKESKKNIVEIKDEKNSKKADDSNKIEKVMDSKKEIKNVDNLNNTSEKNKTIESEKTTKDKVQRKDSDSGGKLSDDSSEKQNLKTNEKED